jgi:hypothetical protein
MSERYPRELNVAFDLVYRMLPPSSFRLFEGRYLLKLDKE